MASKEETKNKVISAVTTAAMMVLLLVICLSFGYMPPDPPIPESGVEVNLGYSDQGYGDAQEVSSTSTPAPAVSQNAQAQEEVSTQSTEESVSLPDKVSPNPKPVPQPQPQPEAKETPKVEEKPKEPELNQRALFTSKKSQQASSDANGSQGNTTGQGNMGKENGNPNATGYTGSGGNGGSNGPSYSLSGRKALSLPEPDYKSNRQGRIVIAIQVDKQGNVISAEKERGTTIDDARLVSQAIAAARKAKFSASSTAAEKQKGTITYVFSRVN
ncbi:MAG: TonB family protein [Bacteroidales bacterium]|nr:TonB family protein [Bacteroidales bacterium]